MKEHYVSYSQAVKLKELGFDWKCANYYDSVKRLMESSIFYQAFKIGDYWHNFNEYDRNNHSQLFTPEYSAPRLDQAQAWLREVKGIAINVIAHDGGKYHWEHIYLPNAVDIDNFAYLKLTKYDYYESALSAGIDAALELLTSKQNDK